MNRTTSRLSRILFSTLVSCAALIAAAQREVTPVPNSPDLEVREARVRYLADLDLLVFDLQVEGEAGGTVPEVAGHLDRAPVLGYVFPTTLTPGDVGFAPTEGILALAITSHPDFDDTPLWDENSDSDYGNDGPVFHVHWVVLEEDTQVPSELAIKEVTTEDLSAVLPPTNPGMNLYLDSPGFSAVLQGDTLKVLVPAQRVNNEMDFNFDAVTAYLEVNTSDENRPMLGVYEVYSVLSGDLSLPYIAE